MKTKENRGVTLIALAVTIIIMLILAGVAISTITGNSGIMTNAKKAKENQERAQTTEALQLMFMDYNIGDKDEETSSQYLEAKVRSGEIDEFRFYMIDDELKMVIKKDERYFFVSRENDFYTVTEMGTELGEIIPGVTVVTRDEFYGLNDNSMKFRLNEDESSTLMFFDEINDPFNLEILGGNVTMYVTQDMSLTNTGMSRSAIDIHSGATLNLYICNNATMTVDSGYATKSGNGTSPTELSGGVGAYAGIHVPEGAILNIQGSGVLKAIGGNAGDGGTCPTNKYDYGGAGGGGAGAGIGGNGGKGGDTQWSFGKDGEKGESCGEVNIYNTVTVYAYGGKGGNGGNATPTMGAGGGGGRRRISCCWNWWRRCRRRRRRYCRRWWWIL